MGNESRSVQPVAWDPASPPRKAHASRERRQLMLWPGPMAQVSSLKPNDSARLAQEEAQGMKLYLHWCFWYVQCVLARLWVP